VRAVYKRAAPYCDDALNLPVGNVDSAMRFPETIMGFQVVSRKDTPYKSAILGRNARPALRSIRPLNTM